MDKKIFGPMVIGFVVCLYYAFIMYSFLGETVGNTFFGTISVALLFGMLVVAVVFRRKVE